MQSRHQQFDHKRQRMEWREVRVFTAAALPAEWDGLISTVIEVQRTRDVFYPKHGEWRKTKQVAYYASGCAPTVGAPFYAQAIRGHWGIESAPQAHGKEVQDELTDCAKAAWEMKVGPSESASRSRLQTTPSRCGQEPSVVSIGVKASGTYPEQVWARRGERK